MSVFLHTQENGLSVERKCRLLGLSRATSYRRRQPFFTAERDAHLRDAIQQIALEMPGYGYRTITRELKRQGSPVGARRVRRLMREDNLLCLRKRAFVHTTDSNHDLPLYPNLANGLILTDTDQLWRADITYVRLRQEFVYLAVILDAYSRRVIGWAIERYLDTRLTMQALAMALSTRQVRAGLVHHSDRGVQYASAEYTDALKAAGITISMSRRANPYDNAQAERFIKTLKYEEVYLREYANLADARACIGHFIEEVYNQKRLHSALGSAAGRPWSSSRRSNNNRHHVNWLSQIPCALQDATMQAAPASENSS
jgi:transposase InsO family protein